MSVKSQRGHAKNVETKTLTGGPVPTAKRTTRRCLTNMQSRRVSAGQGGRGLILVCVSGTTRPRPYMPDLCFGTWEACARNMKKR